MHISTPWLGGTTGSA